MQSPLRSYRKEHGVSLAALADQVGMDETHLSRFERGQAGISLQNAIKISRVTGLPVEVLAPA
jgi:transcriptional regulator with XRE-family HTH domain